jgi:hypothetical protein
MCKQGWLVDKLPIVIASLGVFLSWLAANIVSASAEAPNARVLGSKAILEQLLNQANKFSCNQELCQLPMRPTTLMVRTPKSPHVRITLTSAEIAAPAFDSPESGDSQGADRHQGLILLRGWAILDRTTNSKTPVAASISRSTKVPTLSVSTTITTPRRRSAPKQLSSLHLVLSEVDRPSGRNARATSTSQFAFTQSRCGAAEVGERFKLPQGTATGEAVTSQATYPTLYIATDYDPQFASKARCASVAECNDLIVGIVHAAAVFYESQLGYTLAVARQFGPTSLGSVTAPNAVLDSAQILSLYPRFNFLHTGSHATDNQVDLFHFFTGRTMDNKTLGIAFTSSACRNDKSSFSQAVIQHTSDNVNPVITAHETGHSLNATHTSAGIMRASLGSTTAQFFSSPSLLEISGYLDMWYPECRQGTTQGVVKPTPTPRSSQGGSAAPNPYSGKPVTLGLAVHSPHARSVVLTSTVTTLNSSCSVVVRSGTTSQGALRGEPLVQFTPTQTSTTTTGTAAFRVKPTTPQNPNVYFVAEHTCADGTILEVSRVQKLNPNRIRGVSPAQRSKRAWLNSLRQSIQQP